MFELFSDNCNTILTVKCREGAFGATTGASLGSTWSHSSTGREQLCILYRVDRVSGAGLNASALDRVHWESLTGGRGQAMCE